jgi:hypothetical protein
VDYDVLTSESEAQYVLIALDDRYFLQFNRAKFHNAGTGENLNQVTLVEATGSGSELLTGLDTANNRFEIPNVVNGSQSKLVFDVCDMILGNDDGPDRVILSIALDISVCISYSLLNRKRKSDMTRSPTDAPTPSPSVLRSNEPTAFIARSLSPSTFPSTAAPIIKFDDTASSKKESNDGGFWSFGSNTPKLYASSSKGWYSETSANPHSRRWYSYAVDSTTTEDISVMTTVPPKR